MSLEELDILLSGNVTTLLEDNVHEFTPKIMEEHPDPPLSPSETLPSSQQPPTKPGRRKVMLIIGIGAGIALIGGSAGAFGWEKMKNLFSEKPLQTYSYKAAVKSLAWSPKGDYIATGHSDRTVQIVNVWTDDRSAYTRHTSGWINDICWASNGYIASVNGGNTSTVRVWKLPIENQDLFVKQHNGPHCQDTNPGQSKVSYLFNSSHLLCKRER
jgi:hypothetical protein